MAHTLNALKRLRQSTKRKLQNKIRKSQIKNRVKLYHKYLKDKDLAKAVELLPIIHTLLDKAGKKNIFHQNKVARIKSSLQVSLNSLKKDSTAK
ncbi:MAG: 30S ribosomal protein S20 [Planctomycetes bacterium]|nr:30S ribosomal protein S20 [Planctomycetota bacterium]